MLVSKDGILHIIKDMPDEIEVLVLIDKIMLMAKVEQALVESKQEKGQDWEDFKRERES